MPSLSTLGQYTTAPKRCVLRVLTAVAPLGAMNMYITLGVVSGYGRGTARRRSCIVVVRRPLSLARFIALLYMVPCVSVLALK